MKSSQTKMVDRLCLALLFLFDLGASAVIWAFIYVRRPAAVAQPA